MLVHKRINQEIKEEDFQELAKWEMMIIIMSKEEIVDRKIACIMVRIIYQTEAKIEINSDLIKDFLKPITAVINFNNDNFGKNKPITKL